MQPVEREPEVTLKLPDVEKLSPPILMLSGVSYAYPNSIKGKIFTNCDLSATQESRICIVGENGAGKTTLLNKNSDSWGFLAYGVERAGSTAVHVSPPKK